MIRDTAGGVELDVRVVPRARHTRLSGVRDGALLIRLSAAPTDNAANNALLRFLSERLDIPASAIRIVSGEKQRRKRLSIAGVRGDEVRARLERS